MRSSCGLLTRCWPKPWSWRRELWLLAACRPESLPDPARSWLTAEEETRRARGCSPAFGKIQKHFSFFNDTNLVPSRDFSSLCAKSLFAAPPQKNYKNYKKIFKIFKKIVKLASFFGVSKLNFKLTTCNFKLNFKTSV